MKTEIVSNLVWIAIWAVLGITALIVAVFCGACWHYFTAGVCLILVIILWNDDANGESVKSFFTRGKRIR